MINRRWIQLLGVFAMVVGVLLLSIPWVRSAFQPTPTPVSIAPTHTSTYPSMPASTATPTPTPTGVPSPTNTPMSPTPIVTPTATYSPARTPTSTATLTPTNTPTPPIPIAIPITTSTTTYTPTWTPTSTATSTPTDTPTPTLTATPQLTGPITLTIYLRDTLTETGSVALDQPNGGVIYEEGKFVYGHAAVQIGEMTYPLDEEAGPGDAEQLPDPWRVEFEFDQLLVARTGNQAGFDPKKAQFWVGTLDSDSAVGEDKPYSLTIKLYEGEVLRKSIQVFFTVKDAPESPGGGGGTPTKPIPTPYTGDIKMESADHWVEFDAADS